MLQEGEIVMLHPSYTDLMKVVNSEVEPGEQPVVNSRYSIVIATAKRARQIIDGASPLVDVPFPKPLSIAVEELYESKVKILGDEEETDSNNSGNSENSNGVSNSDSSNNQA
jgi:DNA-directed RNA polymerase subunit omega